jgi:Fe-S-cluster containining protein
VRALRRGFPGDPATGRLSEDEAARERSFARHEARPCPALDARGACELYAARPLSCRSYGPPVRIGEESLPPCRLCFVGATRRELARCRVTADAEGLEDRLLRRLLREGEPAATETVVAFAVL